MHSRGNWSETITTFPQSQNTHHCQQVRLPHTTGRRNRGELAAHRAVPNQALSLLFQSSEFCSFPQPEVNPPQFSNRPHMQSLTSPPTAATLSKSAWTGPALLHLPFSRHTGLPWFLRHKHIPSPAPPSVWNALLLEYLRGFPLSHFIQGLPSANTFSRRPSLPLHKVVPPMTLYFPLFFPIMI